MAETPQVPPRRRKSPKPLSQVDLIVQRNQTEARKVAVLEFVATEIAKLNALLESLGIQVRQPTSMGGQHMASTANGNGHAPRQISNPCTWCGGGPTQQYNVGGGQIQFLCRAHAIYVQGQRQKKEGGIAAQAVNSMIDSTEPTYNPIQQPHTNSGKIVMQPTAEDERASRRPVDSGDPLEEAFEELPDGEAGQEE